MHHTRTGRVLLHLTCRAPSSDGYCWVAVPFNLRPMINTLFFTLMTALSTSTLPAPPVAPMLHADHGQMAVVEMPIGRIEGRVTVNSRPARRQARQYGRTDPAQAAQALPTIVYLKGAIPGSGVPSAMPSMAQQDTAFAPGFVAVGLGREVTFPNRDPFFHNVFSYSPAARFDLGRYPLGESKEVFFDTPGVVKVFCEVHESMRSMILVTENPFYAEVRADGTFVLEGVSAGTWTLVGWDMDQGSAEQQVTVGDGATARVELAIG